MKLTFSDTDKGWNDLFKLKGQSVVGKAGVIGSKAGQEHTDAEGATNADLALIHEFGAPEQGIPERSFLRAAFDANRDHYLEQFRKLARAVYDRKIGLRRAVGLVAQQMASDTRNIIRDGAGVPPPNAPLTIARKGSSRPLVDTGQLTGSITGAVEGKET